MKQTSDMNRKEISAILKAIKSEEKEMDFLQRLYWALTIPTLCVDEENFGNGFSHDSYVSWCERFEFSKGFTLTGSASNDLYLKSAESAEVVYWLYKQLSKTENHLEDKNSKRLMINNDNISYTLDSDTIWSAIKNMPNEYAKLNDVSLNVKLIKAKASLTETSVKSGFGSVLSSIDLLIPINGYEILKKMITACEEYMKRYTEVQ